MKLEPVADEAALIYGKALLVADLHIGVEDEFRQKGCNVPSLTHNIKKRIIGLIETHDVNKLIVLGDLKHSIFGTKQDYREVRRFLDDILEYVSVEIVKGNHDGNIQHWTQSLDKVAVHGPKGFRDGELGLFHGHAHPADDLWKSKVLVTAHEHPVVRFVDRLGVHVYLKTWVRIKLEDPKLKPEELIVMPAFNDYLGGTSVNTPEFKFLGPLMKKGFLDLDQAELYLLDGTFLGKRKDLIQS
jgi:putative SbcD/Mre11-related phosphoesterase